MRRTRYNIAKQILELCRFKSASFSQVMYSCSLSFSQTRSYLKGLVEKAFLDMTSSGKHRQYQTTFKGVELAMRITEIELMFDNPDAVFDLAVTTKKV